LSILLTFGVMVIHAFRPNPEITQQARFAVPENRLFDFTDRVVVVLKRDLNPRDSFDHLWYLSLPIESRSTHIRITQLFQLEWHKFPAYG